MTVESLMRAVLVLFGVLFVAQVASAAPRSAAPGVVLGVDPKTGQRAVRLTSAGTPTYPTVDVTCDGQRRTIPLTRTDITKTRVVATYGVPENTAETMLKSAECRLLIPHHYIGIGRHQIRAAWSTSARSEADPKAATTAKP
jgi:hypothetical protein